MVESYIRHVALEQVEERVVVDKVCETHIGIVVIAIHEEHSCDKAHILKRVLVLG